ncbi:MAG: helix-turn-helix transcriptional regulator [Algicola sp.]|nr:helix-turn-helix transcriptional regulator [Algicola sp.]
MKKLTHNATIGLITPVVSGYSTAILADNNGSLLAAGFAKLRRFLKMASAKQIDQPNSPPTALESNRIDIKSVIQQQKQQQKQLQFIKTLNEKLESVYSDGYIKIGDIAALMAMSEAQLRRTIKKSVNMSPANYIRRFRLVKATLLLEQGQPIYKVALDVGFPSQSHFSTCFKIQYGYPPSQYDQKTS